MCESHVWGERGEAADSLELDASSGRDILLIATPAGLGPALSLLEQAAALPHPPAVDLFFGAPEPRDLRGLPVLEALAARYDWLCLTHAVEAGPRDTPGYPGGHGNIVDVAFCQGGWQDHDAYICGDPAVTQAAVSRRLRRERSARRICSDPRTSSGPSPFRPTVDS